MRILRPKTTDTNLPSLFNDEDFSHDAATDTTPTPVTFATVSPAVTVPASVIPEPTGQAPSPAKKAGSKKPATNPAVEAEFKTFEDRVKGFCERNDFRGLLRSFGYAGFLPGSTRSYYLTHYRCSGPEFLVGINHRDINGQEQYAGLQDEICRDGENVIAFFYAASDATTRTVAVTFRLDHTLSRVSDMHCGPLKKVTKYDPTCNPVQQDEQLTGILRDVRPRVAEWLHNNRFSVTEYFRAPWLETLEKAGYLFARHMLNTPGYYRRADVECLNRLCQDGTKPKTIFKAEKCVYENLKEVTNMSTWDAYRKMCKTGKLTKDTITLALQRDFRPRDLEMVSSILGASHEGRAVFTWQSLINYLGRLDMYEAIERPDEALTLIRDYLVMCRQLGMEPRTDGDSLKREHDIAARLCRQKRNEELAREMAEAKKRYALLHDRLEYAEQVYTIRPIFDYDDLLDEARQQHNCVASYAKRITDGETFVLTMRETAHPDRSLVTVELSPDGRTIRQKYLAYNQPIRNKSMSDFLDRWHRHAKDALARVQAEGKTTEASEEADAAMPAAA